MADTVRDTATGVPSRRRRSVENCSMCSPWRTRRASSACSSRRVNGTISETGRPTASSAVYP